MRQIVFDPDFEGWRQAARELVRRQIEPRTVAWFARGAEQLSLLPEVTDSSTAIERPPDKHPPIVPRSFMPLARTASLHRDPTRWAILYRLLWRVTHGEPDLLRRGDDPDVRRVETLATAVRRDIQRMQHGVQLHRTVEQGRETHLAWYRPDHRILGEVAPFFVRKLPGIEWALLTPLGVAFWDTNRVHFGPGIAGEVPGKSQLRGLWCAYRAAVFEPTSVLLTSGCGLARATPSSGVVPEVLSAAASGDHSFGFELHGRNDRVLSGRRR